MAKLNDAITINLNNPDELVAAKAYAKALDKNGNSALAHAILDQIDDVDNEKRKAARRADKSGNGTSTEGDSLKG